MDLQTHQFADRLIRHLWEGAGPLLILVAVAMVRSIKRWPEWWRGLRSAHWPTVPGVVETGDVSTFRSSSRTWPGTVELATAQLGYSYRLGDDYYAGYHTKTFADEQDAWSYVDALKGQLVLVSYKPNDPDVSVLRRVQRI